MMGKFNGSSRKSRGLYSGFAKRLDQDPIQQSIQRIEASYGLKDKYSAQVIREILAKPLKSPSMLIPPRFRVGTKVLFRLEQDHQWMPAGRLRGRIIQCFHNRIWYYVIQDSNGKRYSIPYYKAIMQIKDELMVVPQPMLAIVAKEQPAMAGEKMVA